MDHISYTSIKNEIVKNDVEDKAYPVTSMLVMNDGDEMCW